MNWVHIRDQFPGKSDSWIRGYERGYQDRNDPELIEGLRLFWNKAEEDGYNQGWIDGGKQP